MDVKGTALTSIPIFVRTNFSERYDEWFNSLPLESQKIVSHSLASKWYPVEYAILEPTKAICDMFYEGDEKGAWEAGRFSAELALKGIYKFFVRLGSPGFIIKRAGNIFSFYYKEATMKVVESENGRTVVHVNGLRPVSTILEYRIGGWMEKSLQISGCSYVDVQVIKSPTQGYDMIEFLLKWNK